MMVCTAGDSSDICACKDLHDSFQAQSVVLSLNANMDYLQGQTRRRLRFRIQERETSRRLDRMMYGSSPWIYSCDFSWTLGY